MTAGVGDTIPCPFRPCNANVLLVATVPPGQPGHSNSAVHQRHKVEPDAWFGTCPASVLGYPLMPSEQQMLDEQAEVFDRVNEAGERRTAEQRDPNVRATPVPEHPLTPRPFPSSGFISSTAPHERPKKTTRKGAGKVVTTAEVQAAISLARQQIEEANAAARTAADKYMEAHATLAGVAHAAASNDIGHASTREAASECESAIAHGQVAIELGDTYGGML